MKFEDGEVVEVTDRQFYVKAAIAAYAKYAALQRRIDNIERRELQRCLGNSSLASQALKTNEEHWFYRELVNDRRVQIEIATLATNMAQMLQDRPVNDGL